MIILIVDIYCPIKVCVVAQLIISEILCRLGECDRRLSREISVNANECIDAVLSETVWVS